MSIGDREYVRRELGRLRVRRHRGTFQLQDDDQMVDGDHNLSSSSSDIEDAPEAIDDYRNFFLNNDLDGYVLSDNDEQIDDVDNHEEIDVADQEKLNDLRELLEDSDDDMIGVDEENDLDEIEKVRQWALKEPPLPHSRLDEL
ncbi:coiled-coil domain-containing protein 1-like [Cotesia glomerata]|nr:coiled-coil domain-containing protein 1-like [Cotesia glomerata]